jgi:hypothetical protein
LGILWNPENDKKERILVMPCGKVADRFVQIDTQIGRAARTLNTTFLLFWGLLQ